MPIYIIEDDPLKSKRLTAFFTERWSWIKVTLCGSFQSGLRAVESTVPDLIILDMTLPTFDRSPSMREGRLRPLGGYDLMRKLHLRRIISRVIIVTQLEKFGDGEHLVTFMEITERCKKEFPDLFIGSVHYKQSSNMWMDDLNILIEKHMTDGGI